MSSPSNESSVPPFSPALLPPLFLFPFSFSKSAAELDELVKANEKLTRDVEEFSQLYRQLVSGLSSRNELKSLAES